MKSIEYLGSFHEQKVKQFQKNDNNISNLTTEVREMNNFNFDLQNNLEFKTRKRF